MLSSSTVRGSYVLIRKSHGADVSFRLNLSGNKEETFLHGAFPPCEGRAFFGFGAYLPTKQSGIIGRGAYVENRHNGFAVRSPILFI